MKPVKNIPASVHQRLKNAAEISGRTLPNITLWRDGCIACPNPGAPVISS
jgi:hypothetical protein